MLSVENVIRDSSLVFDLPLYKLDGLTFASKDAYGHLCTADGALWTPDGRWFDGTNDYIDCGNDPSLSFGTGNFTVECWCKLSGIAAQRTLVNKGLAAGVAAGYWLFANTGDPTFYMADGTLDAEPTLTQDIFNNSFHHLVGGREGTTAYLYIDGLLRASEAQAAFDDTDTADNLFIGQRSGGSVFMSGLISEVRIYNRILSPMEILHNYLATKWRYQW